MKKSMPTQIEMRLKVAIPNFLGIFVMKKPE